MDLVTFFTISAISSGTPRDHEHEHRVRGTLEAADPIERWEPLIAEASRRFGIPAEWIRAVMRAESADRTTLDERPITSPAGAMGLMQVMPDTYQNMRRARGLGSDPYDPHDNIIAGTGFLAAMNNRFGFPDFAPRTMPARSAMTPGSSTARPCQRRPAPICPRSVWTLPKAV
jgi:soluble lytic murein transglycosylase-like protein